ncbi:aminoglycoside phosphotransferase family protein [Actinokineospora auranticolor]|uniref:Streptomycin 6-kinase n=1 Tax=Actinokineospora auranticolor TaxID=155976 RepID=A0A2S6H1N1_9PSEU|nr:aminoglycoside phosphotransferase family protein [Actinokineospora auranticolor]PPK71341.1 streptomycin 6-kinase [Actinokineospora auranticolor]
MLTVPPGFAESTIAREGEAGRRWIDSLPALAADFLDRWACVASGPVLHGFVGVAIPATRADGFEVVLKLGFPLTYNTAEPLALAAWNGNGAVRLLDRDDSRFAMLLERLQPLDRPEPTPFTTIGRLAHHLAIPAPPGIPSLADKARAWTVDVPAHAERLGNPLPRHVIDACVANARDLATDQPALLVHGDLHFGNILRTNTPTNALRAIDPNGFTGDPAYELLPLLRGDWQAIAAEPDPARAIDRRIAEFTEAAELEIDRLRRWTQARATESALWSRQLNEPTRVTAVVDTLATTLA